MHLIVLIFFLSNIAEKSSYDDGYWHRFLVVAPEPPDYKARDIRTCPHPPISIQHLLVFIKELHTIPREYYVDLEDILLIERIFDFYAATAKLFNREESYMGYIYFF
jgi:hypothetical protein